MFYEFKRVPFKEYVKKITKKYQEVNNENSVVEFNLIKRSIKEFFNEEDRIGEEYIKFLYNFFSFTSEKILKNKNSHYYKNFIENNLKLITTKSFLEVLRDRNISNSTPFVIENLNKINDIIVYIDEIIE